MCRLVPVYNVTATHSYIAPGPRPASSAFTAHSGATLIKGNRRTAAPASGAAWPGRLPVSKYPGSTVYGVAVRASPLVRLAPCSYTAAVIRLLSMLLACQDQNRANQPLTSKSACAHVVYMHVVRACACISTIWHQTPTPPDQQQRHIGRRPGPSDYTACAAFPRASARPRASGLAADTRARLALTRNLCIMRMHMATCIC